MVATQIKAWWWRPRKGKNFGDEIGALMLKKMGYKVKRVALEKADFAILGTVLGTVSERAADGCVLWGVGDSWENEVENRFDVAAVRGRLTANNLGVDTVLGDPGLLVSRFYPKQPPRYNVGVVRHYVDDREYPWADIVIDAMEPVEDVINKISSCRTIISSSLHGIIVADSYGIPTMRIYHPDVISGDFKWMDYQSAFDRPLVQIQDELIGAINDRLS